MRIVDHVPQQVQIELKTYLRVDLLEATLWEVGGIEMTASRLRDNFAFFTIHNPKMLSF